MDKGMCPSFPQEGSSWNYQELPCITLISIAAKIYHALLLNSIELEIEKILGKNQDGFQKN